jgi:hypothetical protein
MTIAGLIVDVGANIASLKTGMNEGAAALQRFDDVSGSTLGTVDRLIESHGKLQTAANLLSSVALPEASAAVSTLSSVETDATLATEGLASASSVLVTSFPMLVTGAVLLAEAIVKVAEKYEQAQLSAETMAAKQDVINKAISEGAPKLITYGDAIKYVNQKFEEQQAAIPAVAAHRYNEHLQEMWQKQVNAALAAQTLAEGLARVGTIIGEEGIGDKLKKQFDDGEKAIKKTREEHDRWIQSVQNATVHMNLSTFTLHRWGAVELPNVQSSLEGVDTAIDHLDSTTLPDFKTRLQHIGHEGIEPFTAKMRTLHDTVHSLFSGDFSQVFTDAENFFRAAWTRSAPACSRDSGGCCPAGSRR